jgi:ABC-type lipoprotein release transport system permease subunit
VALRFSDVLLVGAVALVMGFLSALYPALQVKKHL